MSLVNVDLSTINLRPKIGKHTLNTTLLLLLHVLIETARVSDDLLKMDPWWLICRLVFLHELLLGLALARNSTTFLALIVLEVHAGCLRVLWRRVVSLRRSLRVNRLETVPVVAVVELFRRFIPFFQQLHLVLIPFSALSFLLL